jgi:hypothetical protein
MFDEGSPVRAGWNTYKKYAGVRYTPNGIKEFVGSVDRKELTELIGPKEKKQLRDGALLLGGGGATLAALAALGGTVLVPVMLPVAAVGGIPAAIKYLKHQAKERLAEDAVPAIGLIDALRQLQTRVPALDLRFNELSSAWSTQEMEYRSAIEA